MKVILTSKMSHFGLILGPPPEAQNLDAQRRPEPGVLKEIKLIRCNSNRPRSLSVNLSKKETESEGLGRLKTCNREAVQAVWEVLRLVLKETSCGRQQEAAASHSSKRAKECKRAGGSKRANECKRAGGTGVSMNTSVFSASCKKRRCQHWHL